MRSLQDSSPLPMYILLLVFLFSGVTCNQCSRNADLCVLWFLVFVLFLSFKTFPDLREDRLEPSSRRDFGGCRSYDEEADGAPKSGSQLILLL